MSANVDYVANLCGDMGSAPDTTSSSQKKKKKMKRKAASVPQHEPEPKRVKSAVNLQPIITPVCKLNETYPGLNYECVNQSGPPHDPSFTIRVIINGELFEGSGRSKKIAKHEAALKALMKLSPSCGSFAVGTNGNETLPPPAVQFNSFSDNKNSGIISSKNPLSTLNEIRPGLKWNLSYQSAQMISKFFVSVTIDGEEYTGRGISKKAAKAAAASAFLAKMNSVPKSKNDVQFPANIQLSCNGLTVHLADKIVRVIEDKFLSMTEKLPSLSKYKVLAGIVMVRGNNFNSLEVVSYGTGTKCINGGKLSLEGAAVNDCHGEILSRRGLVSYFYHNLFLLTKPDEAASSIFTKAPAKGYQLKPDIKFYLYINTAPCGDGRLFSPHENKEESTPDKHPNRISRGLLRTKIESGEGTVRLDESKKVQTWDGIIQGERLLTMSCSDKIAKWNIVGLQGALLSHFIKPVYLDGIVIGSLFSQTHLYRAVVGRLEEACQALPPPFRLNKPDLSTTSSITERLASKTPNHAVIWSADMPNLEALNAISGKLLDSDSISSLSKRRLFEKFSYLVGQLQSDYQNRPMIYSEAKKAATLYQEAKNQAYKAFSQAKLGEWLKKPPEQDEFEL